MEYKIEIFKDKEKFIASCPQLNVFSYGKTKEKAIFRLEKIVSFYIESAQELGISMEELCLLRETKDSIQISQKATLN